MEGGAHHGGQNLPHALAPAQSPLQAEGHVRTNGQGDPPQLPVRQHPVEPLQAPQHRRRVRGPAAHARLRGQPLLAGNQRPLAGGGLIELGGFVHGVFKGQIGAGHVDLHGLRRRYRHPVEKAHGLHEGVQGMIPVHPLVEDAQGEIQFGIGLFFHTIHEKEYSTSFFNGVALW